MLKKLLIHFENSHTIQTEPENLLVIEDEKDADVSDTLVMSDDSGYLMKYRNAGFATLGVARDDKYFEGEMYVATDPSCCDYEYLNNVFCHTKGIPMVVLETERTIVREMSVSDLPDLYELYDDELIARYVEPLYPYDEEAEYTKNYIRNMYCMMGFGVWLVYDKESGRLCGRCGLSMRNINGAEIIELGYIIGNSYRHRGYATEVCGAIIDYAKNTLGIEKMYIVASDDNSISALVAQKLGFERVDEYREKGESYGIFLKNL